MGVSRPLRRRSLLARLSNEIRTLAKFRLLAAILATSDQADVSTSSRFSSALARIFLAAVFMAVLPAAAASSRSASRNPDFQDSDAHLHLLCPATRISAAEDRAADLLVERSSLYRP